MGAADMVPGVSGGTIALITGIYWDLVFAIRSVSRMTFASLRQNSLAASWQSINGDFIATLLAGILTSVMLLAHVIELLLFTHGLLLWSFFFGLVAGSIIMLLRKNQPQIWYQWCLFILGTCFAFFLGRAPSLDIEMGYLSIFFAGWLCTIAMIIPGISGTLMLVMLGFYPTMIRALNELQFDVLAIFGLGGTVGLILFSRLIAYLKKHEASVIIAMCGFLLGSLNAIWPWKQEISDASGSHTNPRFINILPDQYAIISQADPQVYQCLFWAFVGLFFLAALDLGSRRVTNRIGTG